MTINFTSLKEKKKFGVTNPISLDHPNESANISGENLSKVIQSFNLIEEVEEKQQREIALRDLSKICIKQVKDTTIQLGLSMIVDKTTALMYTFGSYRLGVHNRGTDIDTLCIGPMHVTHEMFFDVLCSKILKKHNGVEDLVMVPEAYVPIAKFKFRGISIDLIYAKITSEILNSNFNIFDDNNLRSLDPHSIRSLNGVRVTDMILDLVPNTEVFRDSLRAIKLQARRRAIYGNVIGFPGGVSFAILVARVCQLYPNGNAAMIVCHFFAFYYLWNQPLPITLNKIKVDGPLGHTVQQRQANFYDKMPVIIPAYPAMNSTYNVSLSSMRLMKQELDRARKICNLSSSSIISEQSWIELLKEESFFLDFKNFMQIICASDTEDHQNIQYGQIESRLRRLIMALEDTQYLNAVPYPKSIKFKHPEKPFCDSFYIGLVFNLPKGSSLNISKAVNHFLAYVNYEQKERTEDMVIMLNHVTFSKLPEAVFREDQKELIAAKRAKRLKRKKSSNKEKENFEKQDLEKIDNANQDNSKEILDDTAHKMDVEESCETSKRIKNGDTMSQ